MLRHLLPLASVLVVCSACAPVAITALGVAGTAGATHIASNVKQRTFTIPLARVRVASIQALNRMAIKVEATEKSENGEIIRAKAGEREIQIELEPVSIKATRMSAVAKTGLFYDGATSAEIIAQTEKLLSSFPPEKPVVKTPLPQRQTPSKVAGSSDL